MAANYYLGVKTCEDAARAISNLPFVKVLDVPTLRVRVNTDRIQLTTGPASADDDLSKGVMILIIGNFTQTETDALKNLAGFADKAVTSLVAVFAAKQMVAMQSQGVSAMHVILGQAAPQLPPQRKWWHLGK